MTSLQQFYREFAAAEKTGRSVVQVQQDRIRRDAARRELIKAGGASLAFAMIAPPARVFAATAPRIAIVGGGIAGLNAALTLQDAGYGSTIYEASGRGGGRVHSGTKSSVNGQVSQH